jgi:hypothetical protein
MTEVVAAAAEQSLKHKLLQSCKENNVEEVKYILSHRLEELSQKTLNKSFLVSICSASYSDENVEIVRLLLEHGADVNYIMKMDKYPESSPLQWSIIHLKPKIVELIILHGADLNYSFYAHGNKRDALIIMHSFHVFDNLNLDIVQRLVYLMLFRNVHTCLCLNYLKTRQPKEHAYFSNWETEMLLYCLDKKDLSHLILAF